MHRSDHTTQQRGLSGKGFIAHNMFGLNCEPGRVGTTSHRLLYIHHYQNMEKRREPTRTD